MVCVCVCVLVAQSCPTLCDPMDGTLARLLCPWDFPGKNAEVDSHYLLQGSSWPRALTRVSRIEGRFFTIWAIREALYETYLY